MITIKNTYEEHTNFFKLCNISFDNPGFYDDPSFVAIEQLDGDFLNCYASFVKSKPFTKEYLERARAIIATVSNYLHSELRAEKSTRRCVEAAMIFSKILEKLGVWNYIHKGSLTIDFPAKSGLQSQYFRSVAPIQISAGHAWLVAPPFQVVDITLKLQPYKQDVYDYIPDYILAEKTQKGSMTANDIYEPEILILHKLRYKTDKDIFKREHPHILEFGKVFHPQKVTVDETIFNYIPVGIGAPDMPLETLPKEINGKTAYKLYQEVVKLL